MLSSVSLNNPSGCRDGYFNNEVEGIVVVMNQHSHQSVPPIAHHSAKDYPCGESSASFFGKLSGHQITIQPLRTTDHDYGLC